MDITDFMKKVGRMIIEYIRWDYRGRGSLPITVFTDGYDDNWNSHGDTFLLACIQVLSGITYILLTCILHIILSSTNMQ